MTRRPPSPLVLAGAAAVLVLGLFTGFQLLTAKAGTVATAPQCESRTVAAGEPLTTNFVTVDVFNASRRAGLANRVSINLQRRGFLAGTVANSRSEVTADTAVILTTDEDDPRVRLVAGHLRDVEFAEPDVEVDPDTVTLLVGDDFGKLVDDAAREIENTEEITVCLPTVPAE